MKNILCLLSLLVLAGASAQEIGSPLDIPLFLSGNFCELRHNHFHSGLDIKTEGRAGLPVKAVKAGSISRISVSPYGYGRAVYIRHPDGTTSVYGHLNNFIPAVESAVLDSQYRKESFSVDLQFSPGRFPVKQGEVFAFSGNTGGSGGPHLHFELRETASGKLIDPLPFFKGRIKDSRPPEIREIRLFPQPGRGLVSGKPENRQLPFLKNKEGKQTPALLEAWGEIGAGIKAYDRMNGTSNIYGVNEIQLKVDGREIYHSVMDTLVLDNTRYINAFIDWTEWIENKSLFMKSFTEPGNRAGFNRSPGNGLIHITEEKNYHLEYLLKDVYGNSSRIAFTLVGKKAPLLPLPENKTVFRQDRDNEYRGKGIELKIPAGNLYSDLYFDPDTAGALSPFSPLYLLGERIPLHSYTTLVLDITGDTCPDKTKYGVVQVYKKKKNWLGGEYRNGRISVSIRELGCFSVETDTVSPVITPLRPANWKTSGRISFKITDNLSGISSYRGTLDGQFILFEYDAKTNSLFAVYDPKRMKKSGSLEVVVTDAAGNETAYTGKF
ncbi:MAG: M23 family metallopeptidase [Candidatus Symbiothrix sp.]|jgi:hypothetical protein|nr:M23 family metallopeptidase [Candidatus Symbiothrix sp.]